MLIIFLFPNLISTCPPVSLSPSLWQHDHTQGDTSLYLILYTKPTSQTWLDERRGRLITTNIYGPLSLLSSMLLIPRSLLCFIFLPPSHAKQTTQHTHTYPPLHPRYPTHSFLPLSLFLSLSLTLFLFFLYTAHFHFHFLLHPLLFLLLLLYTQHPFISPSTTVVHPSSLLPPSPAPPSAAQPRRP